MDLLRDLIGKKIARIFSYGDPGDDVRKFAGRLGGWTSCLQMDTGEVVRFGLISSLGEISIFLERDANGTWLDHYPKDPDDEVCEIDAHHPSVQDSTLARFEGAMIGNVEILVLDRTHIPRFSMEDRAVLFGCAGVGDLVFGVGIDREDGTPDLPAVFIVEDIPAHLWARLIRRPVQ